MPPKNRRMRGRRVTHAGFTKKEKKNGKEGLTK